MTQEEKLQEAKRLYKTANSDQRYVLESLFPELAESEDERIRKEIISALKYANHKGVYDKHIVWLEKQGEEKEYTFKSIPRLLDMIEPTDRAKAYCQKLIDTLAKEGYNIDTKIVEDVLKGWNGEDVPMAVMDEQKPVNDTDEDIVEAVKDISILDMVEPKFKVGDWIVNNVSKDIFLITSVNSGYCSLEDTKGNIHVPCLPFESDFHLWTIQDAKAGDVLVDEDINVIGIFEGIEGMCWHSKFYYSNATKEFYGTECGGSHQKEFAKPATKEQRDLLFSKMKEKDMSGMLRRKK